MVIHKDMCDLCEECVKKCCTGAMSIYGNFVDVSTILKEIRKDISFYRNSGGGVTFGGGEPLFWPGFIHQVAGACQADGIHTAIETCGDVPWENFEAILDCIDLIMFDIKHMDPKMHMKICGGTNKRILKNIESLSKSYKSDIVIRIPIIPGLNNDDNIVQTAKFLKTMESRIKQVDILPYFKYHTGKYKKMGRRYHLMDIEPPGDDEMNRIKSTIEEYGFNVQLGG